MSKRWLPGFLTVNGTAFVMAADTTPGCLLEVIENRLRQPAQRVDAAVAREVAVDLGRQHAVRLVAGIHALQPVEAGQQQTRARQQHDRHRDLGDDERALQAAGVPRRHPPADFPA